MASVVLVAPDSSTVTVTSLEDFYNKVYTLGYQPQSGSVHSNYLTLISDPTPVDDPNEVVQLGDLKNPSSSASGALKAAFGTAILAENPVYASPQNALNAAPAGSTVIFTQSHSLSGGAVYTVPRSGLRILVPAGVTLTQTVWAKPVFDCLDTDDVTITVEGELVCNAARGDANSLSAFRGEAGYLYGAGVWSNGNRGKFDVKVSGFTCGAYLSAWDSGSSSLASYKSRNRVRVACDNVDFGINWEGQEDLDLAVWAKDIAQTTNGGVGHAIYGSGSDTLRSRRVVVGVGVCDNDPYSMAFQFKFIDGLTITALQASACAGLFNVIDCTEVDIGEGVATGTAGTMSPLVAFQRINAAKNTHIAIGRLTLEQQAATAAAMQSLFSLVGTDVTIGSLLLSANVTDADSSQALVDLSGSRIAIDSIQCHYTGFGSAIAAIGADAASDSITVRKIKTDKLYHFIDVDTSATNVTLDYNPAELRNHTSGQDTVRPINGSTVGYTAQRAPFERAYSVTGSGLGSAQRPEPYLETRTHYKITDSSAATIPAPGTGGTPMFVGMMHEVSVENGTAGALGAITWNAAYTISGSYVAPAAGMVTLTRFRWNGANWIQVP